MNYKTYSPFTPGNPVPAEYFVGRLSQIEEMQRLFRQATDGEPQNVFMAGDRGIGKSSLVAFLRQLSEKQNAFVGVHVFLGGVYTLEEMVKRIFDAILKQTKDHSAFEKIAGLFGDSIEKVGLFGISVSFSPPQRDLSELVRSFPQALNSILEGLKSEKSGLLIALDDINGLAEQAEFANWFKSFVDMAATQYRPFPVVTTLIGLPQQRDKLASLQPSLMRVFRVIDIEKLDDVEVRDFFDRAFRFANAPATTEALDVMVKFSSGLPVLMHEIGDATYLSDEDESIDEDDAYKGVLVAAKNVGKKYLDPKVYNAIGSERYRSILRKIGQRPWPRYFAKRDIEKQLTEKEREVFGNFLRRLRELSIIESDVERGRGSYRFVNEIYPVYIRMEAGGHSRKH